MKGLLLMFGETKKMIEKGELFHVVGVNCPSFCDQAYIRDRDIKVSAEYTKQEAVALFLSEYREWLRPDEKNLVRVLETKAAIFREVVYAKETN